MISYLCLLKSCEFGCQSFNFTQIVSKYGIISLGFALESSDLVLFRKLTLTSWEFKQVNYDVACASLMQRVCFRWVDCSESKELGVKGRFGCIRWAFPSLSPASLWVCEAVWNFRGAPDRFVARCVCISALSERESAASRLVTIRGGHSAAVSLIPLLTSPERFGVQTSSQ